MSSNNPNRVYLDTETTGLHPEEGDETSTPCKNSWMPSETQKPVPPPSSRA